MQLFEQFLVCQVVHLSGEEPLRSIEYLMYMGAIGCVWVGVLNRHEIHAFMSLKEIDLMSSGFDYLWFIVIPAAWAPHAPGNAGIHNNPARLKKEDVRQCNRSGRKHRLP